MQLSARSGRSTSLALLLAVLMPLAAQAYLDGANKVSGCGGCHGNTATGSLGVSISGPTELEVGATATYTLSIDPVLAGAGFGVDASAGSLSVVDVNTGPVNGFITHLDASSAAPAGNIGDWSYNFDLTAPGVSGTSITLSFAGLAFNANGASGRSDGDIWNTGTLVVDVVASTPEPATALLVGLGIGMLAVAGRRRK